MFFLYTRYKVILIKLKIMPQFNIHMGYEIKQHTDTEWVRHTHVAERRPASVDNQ
jgi:hypothetical protein